MCQKGFHPGRHRQITHVCVALFPITLRIDTFCLLFCGDALFLLPSVCQVCHTMSAGHHKFKQKGKWALYLNQHGVLDLLDRIVGLLLMHEPEDPMAFIGLISLGVAGEQAKDLIAKGVHAELTKIVQCMTRQEQPSVIELAWAPTKMSPLSLTSTASAQGEYSELMKLQELQSQIAKTAPLTSKEYAQLIAKADSFVQCLVERKGHSSRGNSRSSRLSDGLEVVDHGIFRFFEGYFTSATVEQSLQLDLPALATDTGAFYWFCPHCRRPSSDPYHAHMAQEHPHAPSSDSPPPALQAADVLRRADGEPKPLCTIYTMETPIFRLSNKAMREWEGNPQGLDPWRPYCYLLDRQLRHLPHFRGTVYRALDCRLPQSLYQAGNVVTWNQPSSCSRSPKVIKSFLHSEGEDPLGCIFVIRCHLGHAIWEYSVYPDEEEVLFRSGSQFRVQSVTDDGLKVLLEQAMHCSLANVDVYQMEELVLDSWRDLRDLLSSWEILRNDELLGFIEQQPWVERAVRQGERKEVCQPATELIRRPSDGATPLHMAAAVPLNVRCVKLVAARLQRGDLDAVDGAGRTACEIAAACGNKEVVKYLLQRGVQPPTDPATLCVVVPWAAECGDVQLLERLMGGVPADAPKRQAAVDEGLLVAASYGYDPVVQALIGHGADVRAVDAEGCTPLILAAQQGHVGTIPLLVRHGSDVHARTRWGSTSLTWAAGKGHVAAIGLLVDAGADVHAEDCKRRTALMWAARAGHLGSIDALMERAAPLAHLDYNRNTALMLAAREGHVPVIDALLRHRAPLEAQDAQGCTPLMLAARQGHVPAITALVAAGADVRATNADGRTPLLLAAQRGHMEAIDLLLRHGSDVHFRDREGYTALILACCEGHEEAIDTLVKHGADVHARTQYGSTCMTWACGKAHVEVVKVLVKIGGDLQGVDHKGRTPLAWAARHGHTATIEELMKYGADVESGDCAGLTPLLLAAREGHADTLRLLIGKGARLDLPNAQDGTTALMMAAKNGHREAMRTLMGFGADMHATNHAGETALALAAAHGHHDCAMELREAIQACA